MMITENLFSTQLIQRLNILQNVDNRKILKILVERGPQKPNILSHLAFQTESDRRIWGRINALKRCSLISVEYDGPRVTGIKITNFGKLLIEKLLEIQNMMKFHIPPS